MMEPILIEGHRGCAALYPENTLLSFQKAIELGVDAIEFDVWLSADGVPVISHDCLLRRTCGADVCVPDLTVKELKKLDPCCREKYGDRFSGQVEIPTLCEVLELVKSLRPTLRLGVELKAYTEENADKTVALLKEYGFFDGCWFYAFNGRIIRYLKERYNGRTMGYPDFEMQEFCGYNWYDDFGLNLRYVRSEIFDFYRDKGFPMHLYCADTAEDVELCIKKGASLITANDPRPLLARLRGEAK